MGFGDEDAASSRGSASPRTASSAAAVTAAARMRRQPSQESVFGESRPQDESERDPTEGNILKDRCGKRKAVAAHHHW